MAKTTVVPIYDGEIEARRAFAEHVQSVAFQISLSKRMIDMLREVRDHGFPHLGTSFTQAEWQQSIERRDAVSLRHHRCSDRKDFVTRDFITVGRSLERRGLIVYNSKPYGDRKKGEKYIRLSLAGEIMCELLVTAGLISEATATEVHNG
jgi:hypothetical protein